MFSYLAKPSKVKPGSSSGATKRPFSRPMPAGAGFSPPASFRGTFARQFGADVSGVRLHTNPYADNLARSLDARAVTVGEDVYFRDGDYQPQRASGRHLIAHELAHTLQQRTIAPRVQRAKVSTKKPPSLVVEDGPVDPLQRYSLEVRKNDTPPKMADRALARFRTVHQKVATDELAKALVVLNKEHLGLNGAKMAFWFEGTRVGLPGSPAPRPRTAGEIDEPGTFDFAAVQAAVDEWTQLGIPDTILKLHAPARPKLSNKKIAEEVERLSALGSAVAISAELIRLSEHPQLLAPIVTPLWSRLPGDLTWRTATAFFQGLSPVAFHLLASHPDGITIILELQQHAAPRAGSLNSFGAFPLGMHTPIITSCSVGHGNTCMNKIFKELHVMYGPDVAETYYHRFAQDLADKDELKKSDKRRQKQIANGETPDENDAEYRDKEVLGKITIGHIARAMAARGTAFGGKNFKMDRSSCVSKIERVDNHRCEEPVADDKHLKDPFYIKYWESPAWDSSGINPFDFLDAAVANKRDGLYFFPLGIDAHHSAMIVAERRTEREHTIPVKDSEDNPVFEEIPVLDSAGDPVLNDLGEEETEMRPATRTVSVAGFGNPTKYYFLDQFNDNMDGENEITRTNGLLQLMLFHFTQDKGWKSRLKCGEFAHASKDKRDPDGRAIGDAKFCDEGKWGSKQEKLRQGCTKSRRCMIPASIIWQMLPAHDQLIDKA